MYWFHLEWVAQLPCFFLHWTLFVGFTLVTLQFLRSSFIVSLHVFLGLPRLRCMSTSSAVILLIQSSFLATWPKQRNGLYCNNIFMLLIPSFSRRESELMRSFRCTLHIHRTIARSLHSSFSRSLTLGAQHALYNKTGRMYMLYIYSCVVYKRTCEVDIGKSSRNLPHAHRTLVITLRSQPPPAPIVSPR